MRVEWKERAMEGDEKDGRGEVRSRGEETKTMKSGKEGRDFVTIR